MQSGDDQTILIQGKVIRSDPVHTDKFNFFI